MSCMRLQVMVFMHYKSTIITIFSSCHLLSALVWISVAFLTVVLFNFRNAKLIKASQPIMLVYILIGELLAGGRVLNAALPLNTSSCITGKESQLFVSGII